MNEINDRDLGVFRLGSKPYGKTHEEWSTKWFIWYLSIPKIIHPAVDDSGKNCAQNQSGPVWFLAGTIGGTAVRKCTIPIGKAILFPIVAKECSFIEDKDLKTESELIARTKESMDRVTHIEATIDGKKLEGLKNYRARSHVFDVTIPNDNVYGVEAGPTRGVADGYWILLEPMSLGKHEIHFSAEVSFLEGSKLAELARRFNKIKGTSFLTEVIYDLTISQQ